MLVSITRDTEVSKTDSPVLESGAGGSSQGTTKETRQRQSRAVRWRCTDIHQGHGGHVSMVT